MANLLPTLREKKRYLVYEVISESAIRQQDAEASIKTAFHEFLGDLGMAKAGIMFLKDWENNRGIIKMSHREVDNVKAALTLVKEVSGNKAVVRSLGLSGILEKARARYL